MQTAGSVNADEHYDVIVIGAGFAGLYALHRLRALGLRARVLEQADRVGGTWLWNRYPGARCDIESIEYSYSFSDEIQQEWSWTQTLPAQPEVEAYLNFVADRLDLRRDIQFSTRVAALDFDEAAGRWHITTDASQRETGQRETGQRETGQRETGQRETGQRETGQRDTGQRDTGQRDASQQGIGQGDTAQHFTAQFVIAATGILSAPLDPAIPGKDAFNGTSLYCARFPRGGFDFTGLRVGLIGTGSTGVQATPVIAEQADQLYVFQRSAAYTFPSNLREFDPGELDALKARYPEIREAQRQAHTGAARLSAFSVMSATRDPRPLKQATREEQLRSIEDRGVVGALSWADVLFDPEAGEIATKLYGEAVARIVKDPDTAASLVPHYPFGCRRPIIDTGYYEAFNRSNVTLVDLRKSPLRQVTPTGIETEQDRYNLDVIVYATGFDAMTGALTRIDIRGRDGALLRDVWADGGPLTY
jgi:cation diffusion facilitator CzcD-associated flavoprotein CzcO